MNVSARHLQREVSVRPCRMPTHSSRPSEVTGRSAGPTLRPGRQRAACRANTTPVAMRSEDTGLGTWQVQGCEELQAKRVEHGTPISDIWGSQVPSRCALVRVGFRGQEGGTWVSGVRNTAVNGLFPRGKRDPGCLGLSRVNHGCLSQVCYFEKGFCPSHTTLGLSAPEGALQTGSCLHVSGVSELSAGCGLPSQESLGVKSFQK